MLIDQQGSLLANPIFGALCRSFYEEDRWQKALTVEIEGNGEWADSVTVTMASLAATAVCPFLKQYLV
jgi:hypothetical protein